MGWQTCEVPDGSRSRKNAPRPGGRGEKGWRLAVDAAVGSLGETISSQQGLQVNLLFRDLKTAPLGPNRLFAAIESTIGMEDLEAKGLKKTQVPGR